MTFGRGDLRDVGVAAGVEHGLGPVGLAGVHQHEPHVLDRRADQPGHVGRLLRDQIVRAVHDQQGRVAEQARTGEAVQDARLEVGAVEPPYVHLGVDLACPRHDAADRARREELFRTDDERDRSGCGGRGVGQVLVLGLVAHAPSMPPAPDPGAGGRATGGRHRCSICGS